MRTLGGMPGIRRAVLPKPTAEGVARIFKAIADPSRLRILSAVDRTALCPCLLREIEPMGDSGLSYHLNILKGAGLVAMSARSNYRVYRTTALGRSVASFVRRVSHGLP